MRLFFKTRNFNNFGQSPIRGQSKLLIILLSILIPLNNTKAQESDENMCPAIWYQSEKCEPTEELKCTCENCTKDDKCKCIIELKNDTGTITGNLKSPFMRRYEALVYIEKVEGKRFVLPRKNPVIDQKNLIFVPHILPLLIGSIVDFPNSDSVRHNVFSPPTCCKPFNLGTYEAGIIKNLTFDKECVVPLLCNVHAEMSAFVIVLQNPYFSITDKEGKFTIRNVPQGEYNLTFWHEKLKPVVQKNTVTSQKTTEVIFKELKIK